MQKYTWLGLAVAAVLSGCHGEGALVSERTPATVPVREGLYSGQAVLTCGMADGAATLLHLERRDAQGGSVHLTVHMEGVPEAHKSPEYAWVSECGAGQAECRTHQVVHLHFTQVDEQRVQGEIGLDHQGWSGRFSLEPVQPSTPLRCG